MSVITNRPYATASPVKTVNYSSDYSVTFSAFSGPAYPVFFMDTIPGDRLRFVPSLGIQSLSMEAPLFSVYDAEVSFFWLSWRSFIPQLFLDFDGFDPRRAKIPIICMRTFPYNEKEIGRTPLSSGPADNTPGRYRNVIGRADGEYLRVSCGNPLVDSCTVWPNSLYSWLGFDPGHFAFKGDASRGTLPPSLFSAYPDTLAAKQTCLSSESVRNGMPFLTYHFIQYMFFANWQVESVSYISSALGATNYRKGLPDGVNGFTDAPRSYYFHTAELGQLRRFLRYFAGQGHVDFLGEEFHPIVSASTSSAELPPSNSSTFKLDYSAAKTGYSYLSSHISAKFTQLPLPCPNPCFGNAAGLFIAPYRSSYYEHWLNSRAFSSLQSVSSVEVRDGKVLIDDLIQVDHLRKYLANGILNNANYRSWVSANFDVTPRRDIHTPQYLGSFRQVLSANSIVAQGENLGELAGLANTSTSSYQRRFKFDDYGTFMAIFTLIPRVNYVHQLRPSSRALTIAELPAPELSGTGFQPKLANMFSDRCTIIMQPGFAANSDPAGPAFLPAPAVVNTGAAGLPSSKSLVGYELSYAGYTSEVDVCNGQLTGPLRHWNFVRDFNTGNPATGYAEADARFYSTLGQVPVPGALGGFNPYVDVFAANSVFPTFLNQRTAEFVDNFVVKFSLKGVKRRPIVKRAVPNI